MNQISKMIWKSLLVIIIISISLTLNCSEDEDCYTCTEDSGNPPMVYSNVCGKTMLDYYRNNGYSCVKSSSKSNMMSLVVDPAEVPETELAISDSVTSDCPCKNKKK